MILDASLLVAFDRGERAARSFLAAAVRADEALHTTAPVLAEVWRDGARQARPAHIAKSMIVHPFAADDYTAVGQMLARSGTGDVVDAHLVVLAARTGHSIITSDAGDFIALAGHLGTSGAEDSPLVADPAPTRLRAGGAPSV